MSEKWICSECIGELYLKSLVGEELEIVYDCSYCGKDNEAIGLDQLAVYFDIALENFFEPTSIEDSSPWMIRPEGDPLIDIIQKYGQVSEEVANDLSEELCDMWTEPDGTWHRYGEDPAFIERSPEITPLSATWEKMEHSLKHEARLINPEVVSVLTELFGPILDDKTQDGREVILEIGPNQSIAYLYRARVFQTMDALEEALSHPERHLGPPPAGRGAAGRMNAKGVSVFYSATTKKVARSEVRPPVGSNVVLAKFKVLKLLRILDLTQLGQIKVQSESIFDQKTAGEMRRCDFMRVLMERLVMPVMPELEESDYLITQAIADFLATNEKLNLDGIMFQSAQGSAGKEGGESKNVILFNKASRVHRAETTFSKDVSVNLIETDDDRSRFKPQIWSEPEKAKKPKIRMTWEDELAPPTLELDKDGIEIHRINSVVYTALKHQVQHTQRKEPRARKY